MSLPENGKTTGGEKGAVPETRSTESPNLKAVKGILYVSTITQEFAKFVQGNLNVDPDKVWPTYAVTILELQELSNELQALATTQNRGDTVTRINDHYEFIEHPEIKLSPNASKKSPAIRPKEELIDDMTGPILTQVLQLGPATFSLPPLPDTAWVTNENAAQLLQNIIAFNHDTGHIRRDVTRLLNEPSTPVEDINTALTRLIEWESSFADKLLRPYLSVNRAATVATSIFEQQLQKRKRQLSSDIPNVSDMRVNFSAQFIAALIDNALWNWDNYSGGNGETRLSVEITPGTGEQELVFQFINASGNWPEDMQALPSDQFINRPDPSHTESQGIGLVTLSQVANQYNLGILRHTEDDGKAVLEFRMPLLPNNNH